MGHSPECIYGSLARVKHINLFSNHAKNETKNETKK